jgi:putative hydrolase of the HAD superfamily
MFLYLKLLFLFMPKAHADFSSVKAVLFDIDDTLFPSSEFSSLARNNAIKAMIQAGLPASFLQAKRELAKIVKLTGSNFGKHFDLLAYKFRSPCPERIIAAGVAAYHNTKSSISPYPQAAQILLSLRERGYVLAVASEGLAIKQWDKLIRLGLDPFFHEVFVVSAKKGKSPKFYKKIAKQLCLHPSQILMVGDNPAKDIAPAIKAGMLACRVLLGKNRGKKSKAHITIRSLSSLLKILKKK